METVRKDPGFGVAEKEIFASTVYQTILSKFLASVSVICSLLGMTDGFKFVKKPET